MKTSLRDRAIAEYHELLAADDALSPQLFAKLRDKMRSHGLVYGDRSIGVALRPHFLERSQFDLLTGRAELVAAALEKTAAAALESPTLMNELGMTERERELALVNPGFSGVGITTRMDGFIHGDEVKFVEYNAENPSSLSDQEGLNRLLLELPEMPAFRQRHRLRQFSPADKLLDALLVTYREWGGGKDLPNIAILDWRNLPTATEFELLQEKFTARGVRTIVCSPDELQYESGQLRCGNVVINLVYKRIVIHEFLARYDETHALVHAYRNRGVCVVNPFRCKIVHKKAIFELLTDDARASWFTADERDAIRQSVPWTRRLFDRRTTRNGRSIDLLDHVRKNRRRLVLKPNDDYGGHGVYLGQELEQSRWENAIDGALEADYVTQEAIELYPEEFPVFSESGWKLQPMFVDTNPFLFRGSVCGAMVRLSNTRIVNVTSGGGETGFFVIDDV